MIRVTKKLGTYLISIIGSVMHYPKGAFAIDSTIAVITPLIGTPIIGQRGGFSTVSHPK